MCRPLWYDILSPISANNGPWCCIGDFNSVLGANECRGASLPNRLACDDFKMFSELGNLHHILTRGAEFTWSNRRRGVAHTKKRLDRAICNDSWLSAWQHTSCFTLPRSASDHHPLMLCSSNGSNILHSHFRFHKMCLQHQGLRSVVETHWSNAVVGCPMYVLSNKLKGLKTILKSWNKEVFGNIHLRVKNALTSFELLQQKLSTEGQTNLLLAQEEQAQKDLLVALNYEEEFWKEKSRSNWKISGDRNTSYFHKIAKIRFSTKSMCMLRKEDTTLLDQHAIEEHVLDYFTNLYASENETLPSSLINQVIPQLVSDGDNMMLSSIPLNEEIRSAVFAMNGEGAPGPHGFAINLLDHKTFGGNLALKLDIKKAFDTMDWRFLLDTLKAFGFSNSFTNWVEVILGIKKDLSAIKDLFIDYAKVSGQCLNLSKCKFYSSQANARKISNLTNWLGFGDGQLPFNYLGVPLFKGKPKAIHLQPIADRIVNKLANWKGSCLSIIGRVELVKSIIHSMLVYSFHVYNWPVNLLKRMDNCIRNFIWSRDTQVKKLVTVAWHKVCCPVIEGGLGIRSISAMNQAAILKLAWDMRCSSQEWATFYRKTYSKRITYTKSSVWPGIKKHWQLIKDNSIWLLGNGNSINYWLDNWLGSPIVGLLAIPDPISYVLQARVVDFMQDSSWIIPAWLARLHPTVCQQIVNTPIPNASTDDKLAWLHSTDGSLSMKDAYLFTKPAQPQHNWCKQVWSISIPPSKSFLTWRLYNNRLPTDENLKARGMALGSICNLCWTTEETSNHLFFQCSFAIDIWNWLSSQLGFRLDNASIHGLMNISKRWSPQVNMVIRASIINSISAIWYCRNKVRFENLSISIAQAMTKIRNDTSFTGNFSKLCVRSSMTEFSILKAFNVTCHYNKAPSILEVIWNLPAPGWVKINSDGAAKGFPGHTGGCAIFKDNIGSCLGCFASYFNIQDSLYAEVLAAILAIQTAFSKGWHLVWLECDSSWVVEIFRGSMAVPWKLSNLMLKCRNTMLAMQIKISHIYREGNICADKLANYGVTSRCDSWWTSLPTFILPDFHRNRLLLPNYRFRDL
ncbi:PREDICTED: uncharacterized protein LOC109338930 [Lupinus angustifolius]|uniref:uncharacterized protein LOC109338930 n=1 Tax=Lupinus angustifolius TaxID=3871 RepID=UPI00092F9028|nr:PREDICTED: uncharacterized protein LOC109338930 [Lupinus angustifolius]